MGSAGKLAELAVGNERDERHGENGDRRAGIAPDKDAGGKADDDPERGQSPCLVVRRK